MSGFFIIICVTMVQPFIKPVIFIMLIKSAIFLLVIPKLLDRGSTIQCRPRVYLQVYTCSWIASTVSRVTNNELFPELFCTYSWPGRVTGHLYARLLRDQSEIDPH